MDTDGADVAWSRVAAILGINRLCALGSENIAVRYTEITTLTLFLVFHCKGAKASKIHPFV